MILTRNNLSFLLFMPVSTGIHPNYANILIIVVDDFGMLFNRKANIPICSRLVFFTF